MKLSAILSPSPDWWSAVRLAFFPTLRDVGENPFLLANPSQLSRQAFAHVWRGFAPSVDEAAREVKQQLIPPNAYGVVLDIGAGHGHTMHYLDRSRVTKYIALEPNRQMHPQIRKVAAATGYDEEKGELVILACGAEDIDTIIAKSGGERQVDTLISILSLCTIPQPQQSINGLVNRMLKPKGQFLYYEHVRSDLPDVSWWQWFWTPVWALAFDGCRLDRPTHMWINNSTAWNTAESKTWGKPGEDKENLFWHQVGRLVKA